MRTRRVVPWAVFGMTVLVGCHSSSNDDVSASAQHIESAGVTREALIADIKATYERSIHATLEAPVSEWRVFPDQRDVAASGLHGDALEAAQEYEGTLKDGLRNDVGDVVVKVGTIDGETITFVAGDLSDTGSEYGFYDASGKVLARAYSGQGEHPNARGVDWTD